MNGIVLVCLLSVNRVGRILGGWASEYYSSRVSLPLFFLLTITGINASFLQPISCLISRFLHLILSKESPFLSFTITNAYFTDDYDAKYWDMRY
jgi:hypothetical protein